MEAPGRYIQNAERARLVVGDDGWHVTPFGYYAEQRAAPGSRPLGYLHHSDGSWSFVGADGWPVRPEEFYVDTETTEP
ncbi:hypothetical protein [Nocardia wallacei]|uniref:hypothetical protein n=1 Tax=Nocardia wallacei TaxID=480035 RepID=UPI00245567A0|nr:hypothetical protein [Nocardia wallacei]